MPPSWHPVPACTLTTALQAGYSSLSRRLRQAEPFHFAAKKIIFGRGALIRRGQAPHDGAAGGLFFVVATTAAGGTILLCGSEEWNRTRTSSPLRPLQAELFSAASIRKSWPEIRNRCTQEDVNGHNLAAIPKFTPSNQESLQEVALLTCPGLGLQSESR